MSAAAQTDVAPSPDRVDVLLFEIDGQLYGADAGQVVRIARAEWWALSPAELGTPKSGARALVFEIDGGNGAQLRVDTVHGVRPIEIGALRRLPSPAAAPEYAVGVWLDGEKSVLLLDLIALHRLKGT